MTTTKQDYVDFVAARWGSLYRLAYLLTASPTAAEDMLQTTLEKAYVSWEASLLIRRQVFFQLPERAHARQATAQRVIAAEFGGEGYGYRWWTGRADGDEAFRALGYGGQLIEVIPDRNLVVVTTAEVRLDDPTGYGIPLNVLLSIVDDAIVAQFPTN